eukprot:15467238-Alexandrium_andersonii.AAC.1
MPEAMLACSIGGLRGVLIGGLRIGVRYWPAGGFIGGLVSGPACGPAGVSSGCLASGSHAHQHEAAA